MPGEKADVVMFGPKPIIEEALTKARPAIAQSLGSAGSGGLHRLDRPERARDRGGGRPRPGRRRADGALSQARDRVELRRRLRPHRRQMGRASTASWSPTRRTCSTRRSPIPRSACCSARCAICRRPSATCAPATGRSMATTSSRPRCATAPPASSAWAASARRSRAGSTPCRCRWSITRAGPTDVPYRHYPNLIDMARDVDVLIVITPGGAATKNLVNADVLKALGPERHPDQRGARLGGGRGRADQGAAGQDHPVGRPRRVRRRAEGAGGADRHGERRAAAACRLGLGARRAAPWTRWSPTTSSRGFPARGRSRRLPRRR